MYFVRKVVALSLLGDAKVSSDVSVLCRASAIGTDSRVDPVEVNISQDRVSG